MYIEEKRDKTKITIREEIALMSKNLEILVIEMKNRNEKYDDCFFDIGCKVKNLSENIHGNGKKGLIERTGVIENTISVMKWVVGSGFAVLSVIISILGIAVSAFKMVK
jgi:hypothetical protein